MATIDKLELKIGIKNYIRTKKIFLCYLSWKKRTMKTVVNEED